MAIIRQDTEGNIHIEETKIYLFVIDRQEENPTFYTVTATDEDEALKKFIWQKYIYNQDFLQYVYTDFDQEFVAEPEEIFNANDELDEEKAQRIFDERVRNFFDNDTNYADFYLDYKTDLWNTFQGKYPSLSKLMQKWVFPEAMLYYIAYTLITESNFPLEDILIVDIDTIESIY